MPSVQEEPVFIGPRSIVLIRFFVSNLSRLLWRMEFHGVENIPHDGKGLIIASNHQTYIDPFWLSVPIMREIRYLAWDVPFGWPVIGRVMRSLGAVPVSLSGKSALSTLRSTIKLLKQGYAVMIFPEGSREFKDGEILPFKDGTAHLAKLSKTRILPIEIVGANQVWPQGQRLPRLGKIDIYYKKPIEVEEVAAAYAENDSLNEVNELILERITG